MMMVPISELTLQKVQLTSISRDALTNLQNPCSLQCLHGILSVLLFITELEKKWMKA